MSSYRAGSFLGTAIARLGIGLLAGMVLLCAVAVLAPRTFCRSHGGIQTWPSDMRHPPGVVLCNDGLIQGPRDAMEGCVSAGVCWP